MEKTTSDKKTIGEKYGDKKVINKFNSKMTNKIYIMQ